MTDDLLEQWEANNHRLHWIQRHRDELQQATGLSIPYRLHELEAWLDGHKGVVTRKLRNQTDDSSDDSDTDTDTSDTETQS